MQFNSNSIKRSITILMLSLSPLAFAGGQTPVGKIDHMLAYQGHTGLLIRHANMINPDSCARTDWLLLPKTHPYYKEIFAMTLAAFHTGNQVAIDVAGCSENFPTITNLLTYR